MKRILAAVLALLLLAACAAPAVMNAPEDETTMTVPFTAAPVDEDGRRPFTPYDIAEITQGLITVGDFMQALPPAEIYVITQFRGEGMRLMFADSPHFSFYMSNVAPRPWLVLEVAPLRNEWPELMRIETVPEELLNMPAQVYAVIPPWRGLSTPRGINVGDPAQAIFDSFSGYTISTRTGFDIATSEETETEVITLTYRSTNEEWELTYHVAENTVAAIEFTRRNLDD